MCDLMKSAHEEVAELANGHVNDSFVRPMLEFSMYTCLEGVGNILNGIDLVDESVDQASLIFAELHRRFSRKKA